MSQELKPNPVATNATADNILFFIFFMTLSPFIRMKH